MKVVILAGGLGSRISEESRNKPKPLIEVGGMPILWHIMKIYSHYGYHEFLICCGYKGHLIKKFFVEYARGLYHSGLVIDINREDFKPHPIEPWKISLINTGRNTLTAKRLSLVEDYLQGEDFMLTYGDGLADIDVQELLRFHKEQDTIATISAAKPDPRFGTIRFDRTGNRIRSFVEKDQDSQGYVNIGYMVFKNEIFKYLKKDSGMLENKPFCRLVRDEELSVYRHKSFWAPMDTLKDKEYLEELYYNDMADWKLWK